MDQNRFEFGSKPYSKISKFFKTLVMLHSDAFFPNLCKTLFFTYSPILRNPRGVTFRCKFHRQISFSASLPPRHFSTGSTSRGLDYEIGMVDEGHIGYEAALAFAHLVARTHLLTLNIDQIGWQDISNEMDLRLKKYLKGEVTNLEVLKDKKLKGELAVKEELYGKFAKAAANMIS